VRENVVLVCKISPLGTIYMLLHPLQRERGTTRIRETKNSNSSTMPPPPPPPPGWVGAASGDASSPAQLRPAVKSRAFRTVSELWNRRDAEILSSASVGNGISTTPAAAAALGYPFSPIKFNKNMLHRHASSSVSSSSSAALRSGGSGRQNKVFVVAAPGIDLPPPPPMSTTTEAPTPSAYSTPMFPNNTENRNSNSAPSPSFSSVAANKQQQHQGVTSSSKNTTAADADAGKNGKSANNRNPKILPRSKSMETYTAASRPKARPTTSAVLITPVARNNGVSHNKATTAPASGTNMQHQQQQRGIGAKKTTASITAAGSNTSKNTKTIHKARSLPVKKSLTFDERDMERIYEIETIDELHPEAIAQMWWSAREYTEIQKEYEAVLYLLDTDRPVPEHLHSSRGLHKRTEQGAWSMYENQRNARNAVLKVQDLHRTGERRQVPADPGALAAAYIQESAPLREEALAVARRDAEEARAFLNDEARAKTPCASSGNSSMNRGKENIVHTSDDKNTGTDQGGAGAVLASSVSRKNGTNAVKQKVQQQATSRRPQRRSVFNDSVFNLEAETVDLFDGNTSHSSSYMDVAEVSAASESDGNTLPSSSSNGTAAAAVTVTAVNRRDHVASKVKFANKVQCLQGRKVSDIDKDIRKSWFTKKELNQIAAEFAHTITKMEKNAFEDQEHGNDETRRGLEKSTEEGAWKLYERRRDALNAVLVLQDQQRTDGVRDGTDELAAAYTVTTREACKEAIKFGRQDAREAKKYRLRRRSAVTTSSAEAASPELPPSSTAVRRAKSAGSSFSDEDKGGMSTDDSADDDEQRPIREVRKFKKNPVSNYWRASAGEVPASSTLAFSPKKLDPLPPQQDDTEVGDMSGRSLLDLENDDDDRLVEVPMIKKIPVLERAILQRRLSSSHAPSHRCIFTGSVADIKKQFEMKKYQSKHPKQYVTQDITWKRQRNHTVSTVSSSASSVASAASRDKSEAASAYEEIVTDIVTANHIIDEPTTEDDDVVAVVQHVFASPFKESNNDDDDPTSLDQQAMGTKIAAAQEHNGCVESENSDMCAVSYGISVDLPSETTNNAGDCRPVVTKEEVFATISSEDADALAEAKKQEPALQICNNGHKASHVDDIRQLSVNSTPSTEDVPSQNCPVMTGEEFVPLPGPDAIPDSTERKQEVVKTLVTSLRRAEGKNADKIDNESSACEVTVDPPCGDSFEDHLVVKDDQVMPLPEPDAVADEKKQKATVLVFTSQKSDACQPVGPLEATVNDPISNAFSSVKGQEVLPRTSLVTDEGKQNAATALLTSQKSDECVAVSQNIIVDSECQGNANPPDATINNLSAAVSIVKGIELPVVVADEVKLEEATVASFIADKSDELKNDAQASSVDGSIEGSVCPESATLDLQSLSLEGVNMKKDTDGDDNNSSNACQPASTRDSTASPNEAEKGETKVDDANASQSSSAEDTEGSQNNNDESIMWFKVRARDVVTLQLDDGRIVYLLDNAEKCIADGASDPCK
jgi:hypothetical protein